MALSARLAGSRSRVARAARGLDRGRGPDAGSPGRIGGEDGQVQRAHPEGQEARRRLRASAEIQVREGQGLELQAQARAREAEAEGVVREAVRPDEEEEGQEEARLRRR